MTSKTAGGSPVRPGSGNRAEEQAPDSEAPRKKSYRLHQSKIDQAMKLLGTRTETETIEQALELVAFRSTLVAGVRAMRGAALVNIFDESEEPCEGVQARPRTRRR